MDLIRLENVDFAYRRVPVLRSIDLVVPEHQVTVLLGPSGSGKTTVLRLIAGFEVPNRGTISIGLDPVSGPGRMLVPPETRGVSMVFQDLALWPHMTVQETLEFTLPPKTPHEERRRRIDETLNTVGLGRRLNDRPAQLSGGERQRLALARALITRPRILLMDEPLANLDPPLRLKLLDEIRTLPNRLGLTVVYVTHNQLETFALGDHAAVLHEGRIAQAGPPREIYQSPRTTFVASFLGRCALLPGRRRGDVIETPLGALPAPPDTDRREIDVQVVVRPEDVRPSDEGLFTGSVDRATWLGAVVEAELAGVGWRLWSLMTEEPKVGARLRFTIERFTVVPANSDQGERDVTRQCAPAPSERKE